MGTQTEIREMFDRISPTYDKVNNILSFGLDRLWRESLIDSLPVNRGKILDCCTGTGELALQMARRGYDVIGADIAPAMLAAARQKSLPGMTLTFAEADAEELPFPERSFDAVTSAFSLRNLPDLNKSFAEARRVLLPGGMVLFLDLTRPHAGWLHALHKFYLSWVLPSVGGWVSGHKEAYRYLSESILKFPSAEEIANRMRGSGFSAVEARPLSGGIATLWRGVK